jgi:hypothetical protein
MKVAHLTEPELEFAGGLKHIDPRAGVAFYGPADANTEAAPRRIRVGLIGDAAGVDGLRRWLERCRTPIADKGSHQKNLFPRWPGFAEDHGFMSTLVFDDRSERVLSQQALRSLRKHALAARVPALVDLFMAELASLVDDGRVDVVLCVRPDELLDVGLIEVDDESAASAESDDVSARDFHDLLKARAMPLNRPIQVVRPPTFGGASPRRRRDSRTPAPQLQDEATRAWNLHGALYYKAGGAPWRLRSARTDRTTCFVGVSFFRTLDGQSLHTGVAQVFNELGDGVVTRGGQARRSKRDRQVHLSEADAAELLGDALDLYRQHHKTVPSRVVLHKTSAYDEAERDGFLRAADERGIHTTELLWIMRNEPVRLSRLGEHPPLRGTLLTLDADRTVLYTRGSVPYYATYPGMYVPSPIGLRPALAASSARQLAEEVLALTKLNWNNTQFDGREPVTTRIADRVGSIMRYLDPDVPVVARYAYYM